MDVQNRLRLRLPSGKTIHRSVKKEFYGLSDIPTVFQEHIDKVPDFKTPVRLGDIICATNGTIDE